MGEQVKRFNQEKRTQRSTGSSLKSEDTKFPKTWRTWTGLNSERGQHGRQPQNRQGPHATSSNGETSQVTLVANIGGGKAAAENHSREVTKQETRWYQIYKC